MTSRQKKDVGALAKRNVLKDAVLKAVIAAHKAHEVSGKACDEYNTRYDGDPPWPCKRCEARGKKRLALTNKLDAKHGRTHARAYAKDRAVDDAVKAMLKSGGDT